MEKSAPRFERLTSVLNRKPSYSPILLSLKNVSVSYGDMRVLKNINWNLNPVNIVTYGPNGCGKTTLLSLVLGDNQKAYGQNIHIFGKLRSSGESIWDIKEKFGQVGAELQQILCAG